MIVKSKGIVLGYIKYGDSSIIAKIFTEDYGYDAYIVNSIRHIKSKKNIGHFQPFTILDLVLYIKEERDIQRISEFKNHYPLHHIYQNMMKSSIIMFLTEVFSKLLQYEQSPNHALYNFAEESIRVFDLLKSGVNYFHLQFLLKVGSFLGYAIGDVNNLFSSVKNPMLLKENYEIMNILLKEPYGNDFNISIKLRRIILDIILDYYQHHAHISKPKSLEVLKNILN